ncbi:hypothetical protein [Pasteuria penetrans]|uniref:hypothetical protein n=1 Tax=Pasteuria penetrans TaxID=86005 RepID=UPI000F928143|nr:hypothetical protein [Pasteuria penetrans]
MRPSSPATIFLLTLITTFPMTSDNGYAQQRATMGNPPVPGKVEPIEKQEKQLRNILDALQKEPCGKDPSRLTQEQFTTCQQRVQKAYQTYDELYTSLYGENDQLISKTPRLREIMGRMPRSAEKVAQLHNKFPLSTPATAEASQTPTSKGDTTTALSSYRGQPGTILNHLLALFIGLALTGTAAAFMVLRKPRTQMSSPHKDNSLSG